MPLRLHASLTLHVSARTVRNSLAFACDQSRFDFLRSCGFLLATSVSFGFRATFPLPRTHSGRSASVEAPARIAILHCSCHVPKQRNAVNIFFPGRLVFCAARGERVANRSRGHTHFRRAPISRRV